VFTFLLVVILLYVYRSRAARGRLGIDMSKVIPIASKPASTFEYLTTKKDELVGWARKFSLFPYPFVTACCAMEFMAVSSTPYDTDRFGAALPRFSPRQSDLLMVVGTINHKQAPVLLKVYEQMCEPKWVIAFGVCATSGGFYQNYATLLGIDKIIPVDVYIPGCPPRPETVIDGIMQLQDKIARQKHAILTESF
jgi:NADH-quinone oxidoreductase subunit B